MCSMWLDFDIIQEFDVTNRKVLSIYSGELKTADGTKTRKDSIRVS